MNFFHPEYKMSFKDKEPLEIENFISKYGDDLFNSLYIVYDREPLQWEYDNAIDTLYDFYIDKWKNLRKNDDT